MPRPGKRRSPFVRGLGYALFAVVVFTGSLWFTFPYPELARQVEARLQREGVAVDIEGFGPGAFPGVRAERLHLAPVDGSQWRLEANDVTARVPPLRLLRGERVAQLRGTVFGGKVAAEVAPTQPPHLEVDCQDLDLALLPAQGALAELPLTGSVSGRLVSRGSLEDPAGLDGSLTATLTGVKLGPGKVQGFPVPELLLGSGRLDIRAEQGKIEIAAAEFSGGDLEVDFKGSLLLRESLAKSLVNGLLTLRPNDQAAEDLALVFAVFPGAKGSDGRYTARVRGNLAAPRLLRR